MLMIVGGAAMATGLSACREERSGKRPRQILPDMDHQPKYQAQQKSHFFHEYSEGDAHADDHGDDHRDDHADDEHGGGHKEPEYFGRTQRLPVTGTVAFGRKSFSDPLGGVDFSQRSSFLQDEVEVYEGERYVRDASGRIVYGDDGAPRTEYVEWMPIEAILGQDGASTGFDDAFNQFVALGRENFNIYCIVCHGATGAGDGLVGVRWNAPLPSWHDVQYRHGGEKGQDGYLFHTILYGVPNEGDPPPYPYKMRGYMGKVTRHEAWAIVAYVRTLQAARDKTIDDAPSAEQQQLLGSRAAKIRAEREALGLDPEGEGGDS